MGARGLRGAPLKCEHVLSRLLNLLITEVAPRRRSSGDVQIRRATYESAHASSGRRCSASPFLKSIKRILRASRRRRVNVIMDAEPGTRRHFAVLDGMRGVAAVLIALRHAYFGSIPLQESYLAVDLFFLLSGVVLGNAYQERLRRGLSPWAFMRSRVIRIYPLYLLGLTIGAAASVMQAQAPSQIVTWTVFALPMLPCLWSAQGALFPLDEPAWSLFLEMVASVVYGLYATRLSDRRLGQIMALSAFGLVVSLIALPGHRLDLGWSVQTFICGFFRIGFSFSAGLLIQRLCVVTLCSRASAGPFQAWILLALVAMVLVARPPAALVPIFDLFMVMIVFPALIVLALRVEPGAATRRLCRALGTISYPLYALHGPVGRLISNQTFSYHAVTMPAPWGEVVFIAAMIPLCFWLDAVWDRPIRRRLMAIGQAHFIAGSERPRDAVHPGAGYLSTGVAALELADGSRSLSSEVTA